MITSTPAAACPELLFQRRPPITLTTEVEECEEAAATKLCLSSAASRGKLRLATSWPLLGVVGGRML